MSPNRPVPSPNGTTGRVPWRGDDGPRAIATGETSRRLHAIPPRLAMREPEHDKVTGNTRY